MLQVIDSHVHFWDPHYLRYVWLDDLPALNRTFLPDHVPTRGEDWSVEGIVFVQADCAVDQGLAEVDWVSSLAVNDARVSGIVAFAPLEQGHPVRPILAALKSRLLVKGVRRLIQSELPGFSIRHEFVAGISLLAEYGLSFDLCIRHQQLGEVVQLVRQCPAVSFVLDHSGKPDIKQSALDPWRAQLAELAALPNVSCKLSGLVTEADLQNWQPSDLKPYIDQVMNVFGIDRVMFGSDSPVVRLAATYEQWVNTLHEATSELTTPEKGKLWHDNARLFYRL